MKPLETQAKKERKSRRSQLVISIVIAAIMIFSVIGFAMLERYQGEAPGQNVTSYRNYKFVSTEGGWQTIIRISEQDIAINTYYLPQEVENISSQGKPLLSEFVQKELYLVASSALERQAALEYNALSKIAKRMQFACSEEKENTSFCVDNNLPIKSCDDVSEATAIVILEELEESSSESSSVNYKNYCLEIKGKGSELIRANEKALFMIFNIIE